MDLAGAVTGLVDKLTAAGVRATEDPRNLNPPAALVQPPTLAYRFGKPGLDITWEIWCIVPDTGRAPALKAVSALIEDVQEALGWGAKEARPTDILLADGGTASGYILTFTESTR